MMEQDYSTPVLVLNCKLGGLAIMRSLGSLGVPLHGVDGDRSAPGLMSRYCRGKFIKHFDETRPEEYLDYILRIGKELGGPTILIPTSDELSLLVAEHADQLRGHFLFLKNDPVLVQEIISKEGLYNLARKYNVPSPLTIFPRNLDDVIAYTENGTFPVMLKGIHGNRLHLKTGKKMVLVHSRIELIENYKSLEDPDRPNLMIQEHIPGGDDQMYIFDGYFNEESECVAAFTGHKIRQYPIHRGCASLGVCSWNKELADIAINFMKSLGYKGIVDSGYQLDPRDGLYKVLDINPRVGQAFRLFLAGNGMDVVRVLYLDLTGQKANPVVPREGRRWVIEDYDLESSLDYYREGALGLWKWLKSFKGLEEAAWFDPKDPIPFFLMCFNLTKKGISWAAKGLRFTRNQSQPAKIPRNPQDSLNRNTMKSL